MKLTLAFSSCPNDTFMFDAMVHNKIDTEGLEFEVVIDDIENLNTSALNKKFDITKISFSAFSNLTKDYVLLDSGAALGNNCGPILVSKPNHEFSFDSKIAIPGKNTTANMLLEFFFPNYNNKLEFNFADIEDQVLNEIVDAGVIIHENRFTYKQKGLVKVKDLGSMWEEKEDLPIPLGGIVVNRRHDYITQNKIERVLKKSVEYALKNPESSIDYVMSYAQGVKKDIVKSHISLYVNKYSISLGKKGRESVERFLSKINPYINIPSVFISNFTS